MAASEPREKDDSFFLVTGNLDSHPEYVMQRIHLHKGSYAKFQLRKKKRLEKKGLERVGGGREKNIFIPYNSAKRDWKTFVTSVIISVPIYLFYLYPVIIVFTNNSRWQIQAIFLLPPIFPQ